jgi:hypothetical protein
MDNDFAELDNTFFDDIQLIDNDANMFFSDVSTNAFDDKVYNIDNIMVNVADYCPDCGYNILHCNNHDACLNCGFNKDYAIDGQIENAYSSTEQIDNTLVNDISEHINEITLKN